MENKILIITTKTPRRWDTTGHKRLIYYCEKCDTCKMMYDSDAKTLDDVLCNVHNKNMVEFIEK